jgi:hypothetical protein
MKSDNGERRGRNGVIDKFAHYGDICVMANRKAISGIGSNYS